MTFVSKTGNNNPFDEIAVGVSSAPTFADIDRDGDLDLVVGERDGILKYYKNTSIAIAPIYEQQAPTDNPFDKVNVGNDSTPTLADIDGDGDLDLVVGERYGNLEYYKNTGTAIAPIYTVQTSNNNPFDGFNVGRDSKPTFADIDRDGDLDLVVGERDGNLNYYKNTGSAIAPIYTVQTDTDNPFDGFNVGFLSTATFADIDRDGDLDLLVGEGGENGGTFKYYKNTGSAIAPIYEQQAPTDNPFDGIKVRNLSTATFADIDRDGDLDLVVGTNSDNLNYFENTIVIEPPPVYTEITGTTNPFNGIDVGTNAFALSAPTLADIDGDGDLDLLVGESEGNLNYYKNTGSAIAPIYQEQTGTDNPFNGFDVGTNSYAASRPIFADIDGDGDLDLVVGEQDGTLNYYKNTGSAIAPIYEEQADTDNPFTGIVNVGRYSAPTLADIDGDGDLDLVVGEEYGNLNYYQNIGTLIAPIYEQQTGTNNPFNGFDVGPSFDVSRPIFADIDGDGDLDLVVGEFDGTLNYYKTLAVRPTLFIRSKLSPIIPSMELIWGRIAHPHWPISMGMATSISLSEQAMALSNTTRMVL